MKAGFSQRVEGRLKELGLTPRAASLKVSDNPDLFRNVLRFGDDANPKQKTLGQMAEALEWSVDELIAEDAQPAKRGGERHSEVRRADVPFTQLGQLPRDLPVLGTVAGAMLGKGAFQLTNDVVDYVRRPPGLIGAKDAYALYVEGESMIPRFEPGELVFVHPHRKAVTNDYIVIQEPDSDNGGPRGFIKQFVKQTQTLLRTRQFNPPANIDFPMRPGLIWHKVLRGDELYGV